MAETEYTSVPGRDKPDNTSNSGQEKQWVMDREVAALLKDILSEVKMIRLHLNSITSLEE